jgi:hypothetical protein
LPCVFALRIDDTRGIAAIRTRPAGKPHGPPAWTATTAFVRARKALVDDRLHLADQAPPGVGIALTG